MNIEERIQSSGIVPVIVIQDASKAVSVARALLDGGISVMEITFRTAAAKEAIQNVSREVPDMFLGAGTVVTMEQLDSAIEAGAQFIVSPGLDPEIVTAAQKRGVPIFPGVVTPSEILMGMKLGLTTFKFFPAGSYGGASTLKALSAPFHQLKFLPTGGISAKNAADYYALKSVIAVGGSWMATEDMIESENYSEITELSRAAVQVFQAR